MPYIFGNWGKNKKPELAGFRTFLITGATDGIGLMTAKHLAKSAPLKYDENNKRVIGIHGRNQERVEKAIDQINSYANEG